MSRSPSLPLNANASDSGGRSWHWQAAMMGNVQGAGAWERRQAVAALVAVGQLDHEHSLSGPTKVQ